MYFLTQFVLDKVTVCRLLFDLPLTNSFAQTLRETHIFFVLKKCSSSVKCVRFLFGLISFI